jgi:DNA polymerase-3 subunit gamma/tau
VDPLGVLRALLETVHATTLVKLGTAPEAGQAVEEREAFAGWAGKLSFASLHRLWQLLLKGHDEVARAALPIEACEMALLRLIHASTLPDPGELARMIASGAPIGGAAPAAPAARAQAAPVEAWLPGSIRELIAFFEDKGEHALAVKLTRSASVVRFAAPELVLSSARPLPTDLIRELNAELKRLTGKPWKVTSEDMPGAPTIREEEEVRRNEMRAAILETPVVKAAFEAFPDAEFPENELDRLMAAQRSM